MKVESSEQLRNRKKKKIKNNECNILIGNENKKLIIFFSLSNSAQPYIDVHYNNEGKILPLAPLLQPSFFMWSDAKNSFLASLLLVILLNKSRVQKPQ